MSATPTTRPSGFTVQICRIIDLVSEALGNSYKLKIAMNTLRTVDKQGGLDPFLLKAKDSVLSPKALRLKRAIAKKTADKAA